MSSISIDDVSKAGQLANLDLSQDQINAYTIQLEHILEYIDQLQGIDTRGVPPTARAVEVVNVTREDSVTFTEVREAILSQAPQREGDFYRVPRIIGGC